MRGAGLNCVSRPPGWAWASYSLLLPSLLLWVKGESESEVAQLRLTLCDPKDCSLPGSSVHGIFQVRVLEWVAISFSKGSFQPKDRTWVSPIADRCFTLWATREMFPLNPEIHNINEETVHSPSSHRDLNCLMTLGLWVCSLIFLSSISSSEKLGYSCLSQRMVMRVNYHKICEALIEYLIHRKLLINILFLFPFSSKAPSFWDIAFPLRQNRWKISVQCFLAWHSLLINTV